ncbi:hypothetical protein BHE74_00031784 [Ensete ventricosum]|nr:hypothetical protein BHE74_00031784 [Ensete ventricosum]
MSKARFYISSYTARYGPVHTGPSVYRYADRQLPGGTAKNRPSAVDFGHRRPIEREIDRRRLIEGDRWSTEEDRRSEKKGRRRRRGKEEEEKKHNLYRHRPQVAHAPLSPTGRPRAVAAHARRRIVATSPCGEKKSLGEASARSPRVVHRFLLPSIAEDSRRFEKPASDGLRSGEQRRISRFSLFFSLFFFLPWLILPEIGRRWSKSIGTA